MFKRVFLTFLSGARAESEAAFKASAPLKKMPAPTGFATLLTDSLSIHTYFVLGEVSPPPRVFTVYHSEPAAPDSNLRPLYEPITSSVSHTIFWPCVAVCKDNTRWRKWLAPFILQKVYRFFSFLKKQGYEIWAADSRNFFRYYTSDC